jgi:hypothetical protein
MKAGYETQAASAFFRGGSLIRSDDNKQVFVFKKQEKTRKRCQADYPNSLRDEGNHAEFC